MDDDSWVSVSLVGGAEAKSRGESLVMAALSSYPDDERERLQLARDAQTLVTAA